MVTIELIPSTEYCIESTAKKAYNSLVGQYLRGEPGTPYLEERIELLASFLKSADFKKLRQESEPHILQGKKVIFTVYKR